MQVSADRAADGLVARLGGMVREARTRLGLTQTEVATRAGVHQSTVSILEQGRGATISIRVWVRAALDVDSDLRAYLEGISAADQPRDHVHLRGQELILETAAPGGWSGVAEADVDHDRSRSRSADVLLRRRTDQAMVEVWDWFHDVGGAWRTSTSKIARIAPDGPDGRVGLLWVVRATRRNRQLVSDHARLFASWFPASSRAWLQALQDPAAPMPAGPGLIWISVDGTRLTAARLGR